MVRLTLAVLSVAACGSTEPAPTPVPPTLTPVPPTSTPTPVPPTVTPTPLPPLPTHLPPTATPTSTPIPAPSLSQIDQEGLVAYSPFEVNADDASGSGHHGVVHGATLATDRDGVDGKAYAFDGVDDFIEVMDSPEFDIGTGDMTGLAWVVHERRDTRRGVSFYGLISHTDGVDTKDGWYWTLGWGTGNMLVSMVGREHVYRSAIPLDTWVHLAFVKSGSEITFYVDGVASGRPVDHGRNINDSDGDLRIGMEGSTYGDHFFLGKIDDVMLYKRTLTADEILATMNAPESEPAGASGSPTYLSQLDPQTAEVGWGTFSRGVYDFTPSDPSDRISKGDPIVAHEVEYPHGLYAHAPSRLVFELGGGYSERQATIALVDWIACGDGAQFIILLDGNEIYRSPTMLASSTPIEIKVSVAKGQVLELLTDPGSTKDFTCDWAIWGDPLLR